MDLRALRHFVRLADVLNFSRAAEQCAVTPSTLSREINRLEEECGAPLFERNHHSVSLTPRGQEFLSFARTVESAWREFRNSGTEKSLSGVIKVYCSVTASYLILPEILTLFRREYPDVEITLETGDAANAVQKIEDMDADVAVAARPDHEPGRVVFRSLKEVPLVFICPKSYEIRQGPLDFGIIRGYPFILPQMGMLRKRTLQWFHERNKPEDLRRGRRKRGDCQHGGARLRRRCCAVCCAPPYAGGQGCNCHTGEGACQAVRRLALHTQEKAL